MKRPCVVLRSRNDGACIAATLERVRGQTIPCEIVAFDNASTDGTAEILAKHADRVFTVPAGTYVPGRVLNAGMRETTGEFVVFLNADCTPCDDRWLERLLGGFTDDQTAAVFGRQRPRPGIHPVHARDTEEAYGDGSRQGRWHCFSMASSAIRRSVWETMPFSETLQYSEDIDWTWRARQRGFAIRYVRDSEVFHSHDYSVAQFFRRHFGEGRADAAIFPWTPWRASFVRYALLPFGRQVLADWRYCAGSGLWMAAAQAPAFRVAQMVGRWQGFREGLRQGAPVRTAPVLPRVFAAQASDAFNARLGVVLDRLSAEVSRAIGPGLEAIILGGGYGRGEGGVLIENGIEKPYNDIDLTLVIQPGTPVSGKALEDIGHPFGSELGIEIDFGVPLTTRELASLPPLLRWHDLALGHQVLMGPTDVLSSRIPALVLEPPPPIEALRLLLNRGAGMLWALRVARGVEPAPDPDFVRRNRYKCLLALGDAVMIVAGRYRCPYAGRADLLETLAREDPEVAALGLVEPYRAALEFKFRPDRLAFEQPDATLLADTATAWGRVLLHVEARRTGMRFASIDAYATWDGIREADTNRAQDALENLIRNLTQELTISLRHPREGLYRKLPVLLELTRQQSKDWPSESASWLATWRRFAP